MIPIESIFVWMLRRMLDEGARHIFLLLLSFQHGQLLKKKNPRLKLGETQEKQNKKLIQIKPVFFIFLNPQQLLLLLSCHSSVYIFFRLLDAELMKTPSESSLFLKWFQRNTLYRILFSPLPSFHRLYRSPHDRLPSGYIRCSLSFRAKQFWIERPLLFYFDFHVCIKKKVDGSIVALNTRGRLLYIPSMYIQRIMEQQCGAQHSHIVMQMNSVDHHIISIILSGLSLYLSRRDGPSYSVALLCCMDFSGNAIRFCDPLCCISSTDGRWGNIPPKKNGRFPSPPSTHIRRRRPVSLRLPLLWRNWI